MKVQKSDVGFVVATTFIGATYYAIMRNRLSGSALKAQLIAFGGVGVFQFITSGVGERKVPNWCYDVLPFTLIGLGSYLGRIPFKTAILSTFFFGGVQYVTGRVYLIVSILDQVQSLVQSWQSNKLTTSDIERVATLLSDYRMFPKARCYLELQFSIKYYNDLADSKKLDSLIQTQIIPNMKFAFSYMPTFKASSPYDTEFYRAETLDGVHHFKLEGNLVPLHIIQFLFEKPEYRQDETLKKELLKYQPDSIKEYERPLAARLQCMAFSPEVARKLIPNRQDAFYYYPTLAAILDAGEERVASDPFADLVIPTVEYDDIDAGVNDEVISAVLNEITSENLVDHVSDLLHKFYDQGAKAKEIGLLEVRFRGTRDDLVAEWKR